MFKQSHQFSEILSVENPIKEIVHDLESYEQIVEFLKQEYDTLVSKLDDQRQYKKNKEFIAVNKIYERFYYYRDEFDAPRITICVIYDPKKNMYHRGISICSFLDPVNKEEGRDLAEHRAIRSMKSGLDGNFITRFDAAEVINSCKNDMRDTDGFFKEETVNGKIIIGYQSSFNVKLTEFERKLFTKKEA